MEYIAALAMTLMSVAVTHILLVDLPSLEPLSNWVTWPMVAGLWLINFRIWLRALES